VAENSSGLPGAGRTDVGDSDTVLVIGLGDLGHRIVDALARCPLDRLVVAGRDPGRTEGVAGQAALVAQLGDGVRHVEGAHVDLDDVAATATTLAALQPTVIVNAASRHTWWRVPDSVGPVPYATWLPLHVPLTRALMQARAAAGVAAPVVAMAFPDAVGPVLAGGGLAPELGAGNVAEIAAKLGLLAARRHGVEREAVSVRLVAHHATERHAFAAFASLGRAPGPQGPPPVHVCVTVDGEPLDAEVARELFATPYALGRGRETHALTAATTVLTVKGLLQDVPTRVHVPAPAGRPGGYPALLSRAGVALDLPDGLTEADACAINAVAARWDGIEHIAADGTVAFTPAAADAFERLLGVRVERLGLEEHADVASELVERLAGVTATS
jgi:hypothetical protein